MQHSCLPVSRHRPPKRARLEELSAEEYLRLVRDESIYECASIAVAAPSSDTQSSVRDQQHSPTPPEFDPLRIACPSWKYALTESHQQWKSESLETQKYTHAMQERDEEMEDDAKYRQAIITVKEQKASRLLGQFTQSRKDFEECKSRMTEFHELIRLPAMKNELKWHELFYPQPSVMIAEATGQDEQQTESSVDTENPVQTPVRHPLFDILSSMHQGQIIKVLEWHSSDKWLPRQSRILNDRQSRCIYGLLLALDPLLIADEVAALRKLARRLLSIRKRAKRYNEDYSDEENLRETQTIVSVEILVTLIGKYFSQTDLMLQLK